METIQGKKLSKGGNYSRKYGIYNSHDNSKRDDYLKTEAMLGQQLYLARLPSLSEVLGNQKVE